MSPRATHRVHVTGLPAWLDAGRLLGPGEWCFASGSEGARTAETALSLREAADLQARLRRLGLGGRAIEVAVDPALPRAAVRAARSAEAARRRQTTPGFSLAGARAEGEGRYSLTPEALALAMARRARGRHVVDACAGSGGNTVAFARMGCRVLALEPDRERRAELRHNLRVYGVASRVEIRATRLEDALPRLKGDLLFADPPWGGAYDRLRCGRAELPLLEPILQTVDRFRGCWLKLPPSFAVEELPPAEVEAVFGEAEGDARRVKLLWVRLPATV